METQPNSPQSQCLPIVQIKVDLFIQSCSTTAASPAVRVTGGVAGVDPSCTGAKAGLHLGSLFQSDTQRQISSLLLLNKKINSNINIKIHSSVFCFSKWSSMQIWLQQYTLFFTCWCEEKKVGFATWWLHLWPPEGAHPFCMLFPHPRGHYGAITALRPQGCLRGYLRATWSHQ